MQTGVDRAMVYDARENTFIFIELAGMHSTRHRTMLFNRAASLFKLNAHRRYTFSRIIPPLLHNGFHTRLDLLTVIAVVKLDL